MVNVFTGCLVNVRGQSGAIETDGMLQYTLVHVGEDLNAPPKIMLGVVSAFNVLPHYYIVYIVTCREKRKGENVEKALNGMTALVTGAGSGLGQATALRLAAEGARVAVTELPHLKDRAEATVAMIREEHGVEARAISLDVTDLSNITSCVAEAAAFGDGRLDLLVNNAGMNVLQPAFDVTEEAWDRVIAVNLKGVFFVAQAAGRVMRDQTPGGGCIVNIGSQFSFVGYPGRSAYAASKSGVIGITRMLCVEWAEHNIRVNAICPTFVDTPLTRPFFEDQEFKEDALRRLPLGRLATPDEVAAGIVYLASPGAAMVTGHSLMMDGGWTAM